MTHEHRSEYDDGYVATASDDFRTRMRMEPRVTIFAPASNEWLRAHYAAAERRERWRERRILAFNIASTTALFALPVLAYAWAIS